MDNQGENHYERMWQGRQQTFRWVNGIEYEYGKRKVLTIHLVTCEESWEEIDKKGCAVMKTARHAWITSDPLNRKNVHERCNLAARKRWLHENNILKEKHQGYNYAHIFLHHWNAMLGYHYLMHIARMLNEIVLHSVALTEHVKDVGIQSCIKKFRAAMTHRELDTQRLRQLKDSPGQLRLVYEENWKTSPSAA